MAVPAAVQELWDAHLRAPYPIGCAGREVDGVDLTSLDTFTAGCASSYIDSGGRLDPQRRSVLSRCVADLARVAPRLDAEARPYFERLRLLGDAILRAADG